MNTITVVKALAAGVLAALAVSPALSATRAEHWTAESTTAISITGDVTFTPTRITFANGKTLPIRFVRRAPGLTWAPGNTAGLTTNLYRVSPPQDPVLLHGNALCGSHRVTYVTVARGGTDVYLSVYTGTTPPAPGNGSLCGGFTYTTASGRGQ